MLYETEIIKKHLRNKILELEQADLNTTQLITIQATLEGVLEFINQLEEAELYEQFKDYMERKN